MLPRDGTQEDEWQVLDLLGSPATSVAASFDQLFKLYRGHRFSEELEALGNEAARSCNRVRTQLPGIRPSVLEFHLCSAFTLQSLQRVCICEDGVAKELKTKCFDLDCDVMQSFKEANWIMLSPSLRRQWIFWPQWHRLRMPTVLPEHSFTTFPPHHGILRKASCQLHNEGALGKA